VRGKKRSAKKKDGPLRKKKKKKIQWFANHSLDQGKAPTAVKLLENLERGHWVEGKRV